MYNPEDDKSKQCQCCGWSHDLDACPNCGYDKEVIGVKDYAYLMLQGYCTDYEHIIFRQHLTNEELKELGI